MNPRPWSNYVPPEARALLEEWIAPLDLKIVVTPSRRSKNGDFRMPARGETPRITVNADLGPYRFLLTLVHELAHLMNWNEHGYGVQAHGPEWKRHFARLLRAMSRVQALPRLYRTALMTHARNPKASVAADPQLHRVLCQFDPPKENPTILVDDVAIGARFALGGRQFEKLSTQRTRCICLDLGNGQRYHVSKNAQGEPIPS